MIWNMIISAADKNENIEFDKSKMAERCFREIISETFIVHKNDVECDCDFDQMNMISEWYDFRLMALKFLITVLNQVISIMVPQELENYRGLKPSRPSWPLG